MVWLTFKNFYFLAGNRKLMSKITRKIDSSWAQIKDSSRVNDTMAFFTAIH
jgi:hypothetical protein